MKREQTFIVQSKLLTQHHHPDVTITSPTSLLQSTNISNDSKLHVVALTRSPCHYHHKALIILHTMNSE